MKSSILWLPKEKKEPQPKYTRKKEQEPTTWNCPNCGYYYDEKAEGPAEIATVGSLRPDDLPHITCPKCNKCMGCITSGRYERALALIKKWDEERGEGWSEDSLEIARIMDEFYNEECQYSLRN